MPRVLPSIVFVTLALGGGLLMGLLFRPDAWFESLNKPAINPPAWLFGPVWTTLYILIGFAGAAVWQWSPQSRAVRWWFVQWVLNLVWSPMFFGLHQIGPALIVIVALLVSIIAFMRSARGEVPLAVWCFAPYLGWVSFATLLNAWFLAIN